MEREKLQRNLNGAIKKEGIFVVNIQYELKWIICSENCIMKVQMTEVVHRLLTNIKLFDNCQAATNPQRDDNIRTHPSP